MTCVILPTEVIYNETSGLNKFVFLDDDDVIIDLSAITRIVFVIGVTTIDSDSVADEIINWAGSVDYYGQTVNAVEIQFGGQAIPVGEYSNCRIIAYEPTALNGVVWSDTLNFKVVD